MRQHPEDPRSVDEVFIAGRIIVVDEAMKEANKEENKQEVIRLYEQLRQLHSEEREARSRREKLGQKFESKF